MNKKDILILLICIAVFMFMIGLFVNSEFEKADVYAQELEQFGVVAEALTLSYEVEKKGKYNREKSVDYIYFVDGKRYEFNQVLGGSGTRFDRFRNPQILQVIYSKKNPRNNSLVLTSSIDSIRNKDLEHFVVEHFDLPNIDKFYKIFKEN